MIFDNNQQVSENMGNQVAKKSEPAGSVAKKTAPTPQALQQDKMIRIQKTMLVLDRQIQAFEDKQKKSQVVVEQLKARAKQYVQNGKKADARKHLQQATRLKKQAQNYTIRRKVLQNKKFQLQNAMMDKNTVSSLQSAQQHLKDQDKVNEKLEEVIFQTQQQKMVQEQLNQKLKDMADDDDIIDDVDELMAELQRDVKKETAQKIPQKTVQTNVQANVQKQKHKEQEDEISRMMAEL